MGVKIWSGKKLLFKCVETHPSFFAVDTSDSAWSLRMGFHTLEQKFFSRPNFDPHGHGPSLASSPVQSLVPALSQVLAQPCPNVPFPCLVPMAWPGFHTSGPSWPKRTRRSGQFPCPSWPLSCPKSCPMVCPKSCPKPCPKSCPNVLSPVLSNIGPPGLARNPDVWSQLVHWPRSWPAFHVPGPNFSELRNGTMSQQTQSDPTPSFFAIEPSDSAWSLRMGFHTLEQKFFSRPNFDPQGE